MTFTSFSLIYMCSSGRDVNAHHNTTVNANIRQSRNIFYYTTHGSCCLIAQMSLFYIIFFFVTYKQEFKYPKHKF